jgi:peptidoglycan/xylan/chitin deacetylase (PgdA/CDA1 family)
MLTFNWCKRRNPSIKKAVVLMYHRIADLKRDPWQLAVSPEHFEQHLTAFKNKFNIITIPELAEQIENKSITSDSICLTFDDGYADNFYVAKPLLEKYSCPATFFITSHCLLKQEPFWWDELETIMLDEEHLPDHFAKVIGGRQITTKLGYQSLLTGSLTTKQNKWIWPKKPPTKRAELYLRIWETLKPLPYAELQNELAKIKTWASAKEVSRPESLPMTVEQLQILSSHPLFQIGLHTVSHPALSFHPYEVQLKEILENKNMLEKYCKSAINTIAFPYGNYNAITLDIVQDLKLSAAFSTKASSITSESKTLNLGRFQVKNLDSNSLDKQLLYWFKNA